MISDVLEMSGKQAHMAGQQYDYKETRENNIQNLKLMLSLLRHTYACTTQTKGIHRLPFI